MVGSDDAWSICSMGRVRGLEPAGTWCWMVACVAAARSRTVGPKSRGGGGEGASLPRVWPKHGLHPGDVDACGRHVEARPRPKWGRRPVAARSGGLGREGHDPNLGRSPNSLFNPSGTSVLCAGSALLLRAVTFGLFLHQAGRPPLRTWTLLLEPAVGLFRSWSWWKGATTDSTAWK